VNKGEVYPNVFIEIQNITTGGYVNCFFRGNPSVTVSHRVHRDRREEPFCPAKRGAKSLCSKIGRFCLVSRRDQAFLIRHPSAKLKNNSSVFSVSSARDRGFLPSSLIGYFSRKIISGRQRHPEFCGSGETAALYGCESIFKN